jgi:hypothetical protein
VVFHTQHLKAAQSHRYQIIYGWASGKRTHMKKPLWKRIESCVFVFRLVHTTMDGMVVIV